MSFLDNITSRVKKGFEDISNVFEDEKHSHTHLGEQCHSLHHHARNNRFHSFAPPRTGNDAKWYVDGCGYMWAVSVAIEEAKESIWILDWWLSPGTYSIHTDLLAENGG
ncbi:Phospholipase D2 [Lachnellula arida]|uniref:Phospholipase D2 n=1 Tax=Lachnellula arida TaxID=1316785 RepID=A0A8T9BK89_9HELO|nr:Phospholipase D2 [Lachnellula arida]